MAKTHFQRLMVCKQWVYALSICNDQTSLEAYCGNMQNQILSKEKCFRTEISESIKKVAI